MILALRVPCTVAAEALSSSSPTATPGFAPASLQEPRTTNQEDAMKGSQKPRKPGKKPAQKTLKERRIAKRAAAKHGRGLDV